MGSRTTVRRASLHDAEAIARLSDELGYPVRNDAMRERIQAVLGSANQLLIVAEDPTGVIGWLQALAACVVDAGFRVEILGLVVSSSARRSGAGRALVAEAERWAQSLGAETIVVRSKVERVESHQFYPALGFHLSKTQKVYHKLLPESARRVSDSSP